MANQRKKAPAKKKPHAAGSARSSVKKDAAKRSSAKNSKPVVRKSVKTKATVSSRAARKPVSVKKPVRKTAAAKQPVKKATPRKAAPSRVPAPPRKAVPVRAPAAPPAKKGKRLNATQLVEFRKILLNLRDSIVDEISFLTGETLNKNQREAAGDLSNYGLHMADQGTDNFDREFALNLASNEQDVLYEIDEALQRIDAGVYGICEQTGQPIEVERLRVLPYARLCRAAQEELERHTKRHRSSNAAASMSYEEEEPLEE